MLLSAAAGLEAGAAILFIDGSSSEAKFLYSQKNIVSGPTSLERSWRVWRGDFKIDGSLGVIRLRTE